MPDKYDRKADWEKQAKCFGADTERFYPLRDRHTYKSIADEAKGICRGTSRRTECPVRKACLLHAINVDEQHGIWGGMSHRERNAFKRKADRMAISVEELYEKGGM